MTTTQSLFVLIACEESQAETAAFRNLGHHAYSCDVQPCRPGGHPEWHIHGDVRPYLHGQTDFVTMDGSRHSVPGWDLIIAHPPCTYISRISSPWMYRPPFVVVWHDGRPIAVNPDRYAGQVEGVRFFRECLAADAKYVAVENPQPMAMAGLPHPDAYADPSWYGVKYTKKTLYWLRGLPPPFAGATHPNPRCFATSSRGKYRSRTFPELADALARQWSDYIITQLTQQTQKATQ